MSKGKLSVRCCLLMLLCIIVGGVLITAANYLPVNSKIKADTMDEISKEGGCPEVPSLQGEYGNFQSMEPTALELFTDSLMLRMALYEGEGEGLTQAFLCYSTQPQYEIEYSRYWHGYVVILRALLLVFDYYEIRILNALCQSIIVAITVLMLWQQKGRKYALALGTSYLLLMPMALGYCLQYTWVFYASFVPLLIYIKNRSFWEKCSRYIYYFMAVGAVTIYLDLLTYPLLSWGLLITWWIILDEKIGSVYNYLKKVVFSGVAWIIGYAGMWIGKWALGSVILRQNLFAKAISEAFLWTVNEGDSAISIKDRLNALYINWETYDYKIYLIVLLAWLLYWMIHGVLRGNNKSSKAPALLLIFCSGFVWYIVLAGHVTVHHIFTHRIYGVSIAAFLGMILLSTEGNSLRLIGWKHVLSYVCTLAALGVIGTVLMLQLRTDFSHHNGEYEFIQVTLNEPAYMTFTPAYSQVTQFNIGFSVVDGSEGWCRVQILDQDQVEEELLLEITKYADGNYHEIEVDWKLQAGHSYTMVVEPVQMDGELQLWVTDSGELPLPEYGGVTVGEETLSGQMLSGLSYWCIFPDASRRLLFAGSFMAIFMMVLYACCSVKKADAATDR